MKIGLELVKKSHQASRTNEPTNKQTSVITTYSQYLTAQVFLPANVTDLRTE